MKFKTKFTLKDTEYYERWFNFYPKWSKPSLLITKSYYFDPRPKIITEVTTIIMLIGVFFTGFSLWSLIWIPFIFKSWGELYITLPFDSGIKESCEYNQYGFYFYGESSIFDNFIISHGKESKFFYMPWSLTWYRTSILLKDDTWEHESRESRKNFYEDKWKDKQKVWSYDYLDKYDYTRIPTKIYIKKREWRRRWLMKVPFFNLVNTTIDVHFSKEVGSRKGSWKGGTIGCSYKLLKNEDPIECIKRMELNRKFR